MTRKERIGEEGRAPCAPRRRPALGLWLPSAALLAGLAMAGANPALAAISCTASNTVTANLVVLDQQIVFNRLGSQNVNGMIFALKRDTVDATNLIPCTMAGSNCSALSVVAQNGIVQRNIMLRPDKRPRPLILRVPAGSCLKVNLDNELNPTPNPKNLPLLANNNPNPVDVDEQTLDRHVSFHANGMQLVNDIGDDGSYVGKNPLRGNNGTGGLIAPGESASYMLYATKEGQYVAHSYGATFGSEGSQGNSASGLFGAVFVEPVGAKIYRSQLTEEEMRLASLGKTTAGQPIVNYEATYPNDCAATFAASGVWCKEGKAGRPILNMIQVNPNGEREFVHNDINAIIAGPNADGSFPPSTYPLESQGRRNPTVPNRLEPFREYGTLFHDEVANGQAFPGWYRDDVFKQILNGVRDNFMINFGSGGIGSEIIANRLGVGPMHDCLDCAYEEFFLTSFTVSDPATLVDIPANVGLEGCLPSGQGCDPSATGPKATTALFPEDPANIHHSYTGDFVKFRNTHIGKEQHVFHLHNHQWLYDANDDNSNYLDAQGIGPGVGYTYEINFGGSGNRNKTAGDAIFHCHFYPHFAQGMWEHWRNHDVFEQGTVLEVTPHDGQGNPTGFHSVPFAQGNSPPAKNVTYVRALPDGEIQWGVHIPALVPLPGKAMAVMPGRVSIVAKLAPPDPLCVGTCPQQVLGSNSKVDRAIDPATGKVMNPGFPFWIAGVEDTVGQRPPSPVLDMITSAKATALKQADPTFWKNLDPKQADGFDGGLPRHTLDGIAAAAHTAADPAFVESHSRLDFGKEFLRAVGVFYPEEGTDVEQGAMAFHAKRLHPSFAVLPNGTTRPANFVTNGGGGPAVGAPFHEPCIDDAGSRLNNGVIGKFFDGKLVTPTQLAAGTPQSLTTTGSSVFNADNPRVIKGAAFQYDAVFNKAGYHYPQERIEALWQDVYPTIDKVRPGEPLVMRMNTFDCAVYSFTNLVPKFYQLDDFQVRTPTDIIGQHIHLPKWDLTTTDGAANGWNYEDGSLAPGAVRERIAAINAAVAKLGAGGKRVGTGSGATFTAPATLAPAAHPFFGADTRGQCPGGPFCGARTTMERWFSDPVVNAQGTHRGLGIVFTHDHFGPSTHQQIGLYSTMLMEPPGSAWKHNETGQQLGASPITGAAAFDANLGVTRIDGGPTSWQAQIITTPGIANRSSGSLDGDASDDSYREFYFEFSDFQHAYEAGVYAGANQDGQPQDILINPNGPFGQPDAPALRDTFRFALNPTTREQDVPAFPGLVIDQTSCAGPLGGRPPRPCPTAISDQDPGLIVMNLRIEPVALRIYDPNKIGPDGTPGMQADGIAGDLGHVFRSLDPAVNPRKFEVASATFGTPGVNGAKQVMNDQPVFGDTAAVNVPPGLIPANMVEPTRFPSPINFAGVLPGDPFTPMIRTYSGDNVKIKIQAGGDEEEHNTTIHGLKWLQAGSGYGKSPNSGWRNAQAAGISEQFTLSMPVFAPVGQSANSQGAADYLYTVDASVEGWWDGDWGIIRNYSSQRSDLAALPSNPSPVVANNPADFHGVCPTSAPNRNYDVTAVLANDALPAVPGITIVPPDTMFGRPLAQTHVGGPLNPNGGTLVVNPRKTVTQTFLFEPDDGGVPFVVGGHAGPLHDPTAILYVHTADLDAKGKLKAGVPIEPLTLRAAAGECIKVTLRNKLPDPATRLMPDLPSVTTMQAMVKRERFDARGAVSFQSNLFRPSAEVGLHPQMVAYDVTTDDGTNVGVNPVQTLSPGKGTHVYTWYAGDLALAPSGRGQKIVATPVEFGGVSISPADKIKQGMKGLFGTLVVEPKGSTWMDDFDCRPKNCVPGARTSRLSATVNPAGTAAASSNFRDFSVVMGKTMSFRYADGFPLENINGQPFVPEDNQDPSDMSLNYGTEPLWFRFTRPVMAPFGHANGAGFGDVINAHEAYSNSLVDPATGQAIGDPATPVFVASAGQPYRMHLVNPHGASRGSTFIVHGHVWQRYPYLAQNVDANGFPNGVGGVGGVGSVAIGNNPLSFYQGAQESFNPYAHFDLVFPSAGGENAIRGDYLFRDLGSFGITNGLWGIVRVQ